MSRTPHAAPTVASLVAKHGDVQVLPPSFAQQRFWVLDQIEGDAGAYTIPLALRLTGALDTVALERALALVVARHESLRTVFALEGDALVQVVLPHVAVPLVVEDSSASDTASRDVAVHAAATTNANASFDLAVGPLVRGRLLRVREDEHVLLLAFHHIAFDGWSTGVLFDEMERAYGAFHAGEEPVMPMLPLQYPDFSVWQRRAMQGGAAARQLAYWTDVLQDLPVLELQTDRVRPLIQTSSGGKRERGVPADIVSGIRALARREGATPFMAFLAGFVALLSRYADQTDVVVGSITSGRQRPELEPLIGLFVNTLAIRTNLSGEPSFVELLHRVRERALAAYANQDLPFERLVSHLAPERSLGRSPLFQAMIILQNAPLPAFQSPELALTPVEVAGGTAKFDLTLYLVESAEGLAASLEYSTDLFEAGTIGRLLGHFQTLLESAVADPDTPIGALAMLSEAEQSQLLGQWGEDETEAERDALAALDGLSDEELDSFLTGLAPSLGDEAHG